MSFKSFLIAMVIVSVCSWIAWIVVLCAIDPTNSGFLGFLLFYTTLALSLLSTLTLAGSLFRFWFWKNEPVFRHVIRSLRQSILLSGLFIFSLFLAGQGMLAWWVILLLIIFTACLETIFLGSKKIQKSADIS